MTEMYLWWTDDFALSFVSVFTNSFRSRFIACLLFNHFLTWIHDCLRICTLYNNNSNSFWEGEYDDSNFTTSVLKFGVRLPIQSTVDSEVISVLPLRTVFPGYVRQNICMICMCACMVQAYMCTCPARQGPANFLIKKVIVYCIYI